MSTGGLTAILTGTGFLCLPRGSRLEGPTDSRLKGADLLARGLLHQHL